MTHLRLEENIWTKIYGVNTASDNATAVQAADVIILAVKPQMAAVAITADMVEAIGEKAIIISIMGSVDLDMLHKLVPGHAIVRVMPNTPLAVGAGMTAIAPDKKATKAAVEAAKAIFGSCGEVVEVAESAMEAITAISGCGPGCMFLC